MRISGLVLVSALFGLTTPAAAQDAVVKIYGERPGGASQGTGFFTSGDGQIVTAYHVVEGASRIRVVHDRLGTFADLRVEFIAPQYDLAVLRLENVVDETPSLALDVAADLSGQLELSGYPRGGLLQRFRGHATRTGVVNSHTIRDDRGRRLFDEELDAVIYSGMSGGPVMGPGGVIGVLSGSYSEGGGIGWAIPAKYLQQLTEVNRRPDELRWPRLTLMAAAWRNLRATVRLNTEASRTFERFVEEVETAARIFDEMYQQALTVRLNFMAHRPFLQRVIDDPALRNDWDAASRFLEPTGTRAFGSFRRFLDLSSEYADISRRLGPAMAGTITWITQESGLDDRRGQALAEEIREIRRDIADLRGGIDAYLGIDQQEVLASLPILRQGLERTAGRAGEQARVQLTFIDTWLPAIERYASGDALVFMTTSISALRRLAGLFEPIVYEVQ